MNSRTMAPYWQLYHALPLEVQRLADRAFARFEQDPFYPSLRVKEINHRRGVWSARINDEYRVLGFREGSQMTWFWIGSHSEYDRMISQMQ